VTVDVVIPTLGHLDPSGRFYMNRAIASVRSQVYPDGSSVDVRILLGWDDPDHPAGQAATTNAAAARGTAPYLAVLYDDDVWEPGHLARHLDWILPWRESPRGRDLVTSDWRGAAETPDVAAPAVGHYPVPSTWLVRRETWEKLGGLDPAYKAHPDSAFLGLVDPARRIHLLHAGADLSADAAGWHLTRCGVEYVFTDDPLPLVTYTVRRGGVAGTLTGPERLDAVNRLVERHGRVPW